MFKNIFIILFCLCSLTQVALANDPLDPNGYKYYNLNGEIITNYVTRGRKLGFVRVKVQFLIKSSENYKLVEENEPMIRDIIITILGEQEQSTIKSSAGRANIITHCLDEINTKLSNVTNKKTVIENLFVTKYIYQ